MDLPNTEIQNGLFTQDDAESQVSFYNHIPIAVWFCIAFKIIVHVTAHEHFKNEDEKS